MPSRTDARATAEEDFAAGMRRMQKHLARLAKAHGERQLSHDAGMNRSTLRRVLGKDNARPKFRVVELLALCAAMGLRPEAVIRQAIRGAGRQ